MNRILAAILLLVIIVLHCSRRAETSFEASITLWPDAPNMHDLKGWKTNGFSVTSVATLNRETLYDISIEPSQISLLYHEPVPWLSSGDECQLWIDFGHGMCEASEVIPGDFSIISPDTNFVLTRYEDLTITWEPAVGADWYHLRVCIGYMFHNQLLHFSYNTTVDTTTYTLDTDIIFPSNVDSLDSWYAHKCEVYVGAVAGPRLVSDEHGYITGEESNFVGDATGFFWCYYWIKDVFRSQINESSSASSSQSHNK